MPAKAGIHSDKFNDSSRKSPTGFALKPTQGYEWTPVRIRPGMTGGRGDRRMRLLPNPLHHSRESGNLLSCHHYKIPAFGNDEVVSQLWPSSIAGMTRDIGRVREIFLPALSYLFRAHMGKQDHITNAGGIGKQHYQPVNAYALARSWRHSVLKCPHIIRVVVHRFIVA